jgi:hypothetical protein
VRYAILNDKREVVPVDDVLTWGRWFEEHRKARIVKQDIFFGDVGVDSLETFDLGMNHSWHPEGSPEWFETMIFNGPLDGDTWRCESWEQAEAQHARAVEYAKVGVVPEGA